MTEYDKLVKEENGVLYSIASVRSLLMRLKEYEDLDALPAEIKLYKNAYNLLGSMPTCNTCAEQASCKYVSWGDPVVYRCPHYKEDDYYAHR